MVATQAVSFTVVCFEDGFWAPRQAAVRDTTIPFPYRQYVKAGIFAALEVRTPVDPLPIAYEVTPIGTKPATPVMYWDSDIGKWIEAAAYALATQRDAQLEAAIDDIVARIEAAQEPDGYFNRYFQRRAPYACPELHAGRPGRHARSQYAIYRALRRTGRSPQFPTGDRA